MTPAPDMPDSPQSPEFAATRWTMVLTAGDRSAGSRAHEALAQLAQAYWFPLYAYLRRQGRSAADAEDLTQAFFARLIEKNTLSAADRTKGKFRTFLLTSFQNFVISEYHKGAALKRGGGNVLNLDAMDAETRYHQEPASSLSPEKVYEQRWAWAVLDQVLAKLRLQYQQRGLGEEFDVLKTALVPSSQPADNAKMAEQLGLSIDTLNVAIHRMRRRYRDLVRAEIAQTVADPSLIDEEIQYLLACL